MRAETAESEEALRNPNRGVFVGCCAQAEKGSAKSIEQKDRRVIFLCIGFPLIDLALTLALSRKRAREAAPQTKIQNHLCHSTILALSSSKNWWLQ